MAGLVHKSVERFIVKWLSVLQGCDQFLINRKMPNSYAPDVLAYDGLTITQVEVKASKQDFYAAFSNKNMKHRGRDVFLANKNYIACPVGMLKDKSIPANWGLLWVNTITGNVEVKKKPILKYNSYYNAYIRRNVTASKEEVKRVMPYVPTTVKLALDSGLIDYSTLITKIKEAGQYNIKDQW